MRIIFSILFLLLIIWSCANQGNISGGLKDENPPILLSAVPANNSVNFRSKTFELFFDENIKVSNIKQNLLVSPFLEESPTIKVRPKSILVSFNEDLLPNTTYTFNFGSAIADLNESNELAGFTYVFSTGEMIDSLSLRGTAINALTGKLPEKGAWAILYDGVEDSLFTTTAPNYVAPILEDGSFSFQNLKAGEYKIFGIRDNNVNYFYDLANEEIAFSNTIYTVTEKINSIEKPLQFFYEKPQLGFIKKAVNDKVQSLLFETSTSSKRFGLILEPKYKPVYSNLYEDSIRMWFAPQQPLPDSALLYFDDVLVDTINFVQKVFEVKDSTFKLKVKNIDNFTKYKPIYIHASLPFERNIDLDEPVLLEDSLFVAGGVGFKRDSIDARKLFLDYDWAYGKTYIIEMNDSLFSNVLNLPSDSLRIQFTVPSRDAFSGLNINFLSEKYKGDQLIFQLLKKEEVFLEKIISDSSIILTGLPPGKYKSKIIIDANKNGVWDTGNLSSKLAPETVLNFETEIELRPNWDLDVAINLDE